MFLGACARTELSSWSGDVVEADATLTGTAASTVGGSGNVGPATSTVGAIDGTGTGTDTSASNTSAGGGAGTSASASGGAAVSTGAGGGAGSTGSTTGGGTAAIATTGTTGATEPEPDPDGCVCVENQVCDLETQICHCAEGYVELPGSAGICSPDPCAGVTCGGKGSCSVAENGRAQCDCEGDWSGLECNLRWYTIDVPPFAEDIAFDADGNGWLATTEGLLFWDFNDTPENTADDSWQLFRDSEASANDVQSVVIDSRGVKWMLAGHLYRLDDNGTPTNTADDTWENYEITHWRSPRPRRIVLDGEDRLWCFSQTDAGVKVLPAAEFQAGPPEVSDPKWISLFTTELVHDVAVAGDGVWVAAESGLYYVSLGGTLADESDDVWTDFSDVPALAGQVVSSIEVNPAKGSVWFNTARGIVRLTHGDDPLNEGTNTWAPWSPEVDEAPVEIGPVIAVGPDDAVWLRSPQGAALRVADAETGTDSLTQYHPSSCPEYATTAHVQWVDRLVVDERGDMWLSWGGSLLHYDDGGTATDPSDDRWTRLGRLALSESVQELFPLAEGGVWVKSYRGDPTSTPGCSGSESLYYVEVGALTNGLDDVWVRHPLNDEMSRCFALLGPDAAGHVWVKDRPPLNEDEGAWHLIDVGTTPADPSDDAWTTWTAAEAPGFSASVAVVDPVQGLWIGDYLFSYGASLSDASDDTWWQLDAQSPSAMALDAGGGRWFGGARAVLRYLDDGGTPELAADDLWLEYSSADGLPVGAIRDIRIDALNRPWILGNRWDEEPQLCRLEQLATPTDTSDDTWTCYTTNDGLISPWVTAMAMAPAGNLWIGTNIGLEYLEFAR